MKMQVLAVLGVFILLRFDCVYAVPLTDDDLTNGLEGRLKERQHRLAEEEELLDELVKRVEQATGDLSQNELPGPLNTVQNEPLGQVNTEQNESPGQVNTVQNEPSGQVKIDHPVIDPKYSDCPPLPVCLFLLPPGYVQATKVMVYKGKICDVCDNWMKPDHPTDFSGCPVLECLGNVQDCPRHTYIVWNGKLCRTCNEDYC